MVQLTFYLISYFPLFCLFNLNFFRCATTEEVLTTKTSTAPAPVPAVNPLAPAAAADAKWVEAFLKKYQQIVAGVAIAVGFFFAFTGYKYFNVTLFLSAACIAGFVSFTLIDYYQPNVQTSKPYVVIGATAALALFSGFVVTKLRKLGVFAAGALGGGKLKTLFFFFSFRYFFPLFGFH